MTKLLSLIITILLVGELATTSVAQASKPTRGNDQIVTSTNNIKQDGDKSEDTGTDITPPSDEDGKEELPTDPIIEDNLDLSDDEVEGSKSDDEIEEDSEDLDKTTSKKNETKLDVKAEGFGEGCVTFYSTKSFSISISQKYTTDGTIEYNTGDLNDSWQNVTFGVKTAIDSELFDNVHSISIRGTGVRAYYYTYKYSTDNLIKSALAFYANDKIYSIGSIETLLDYQLYANREHPQMDPYCFLYLFKSCEMLQTAPQLTSTQLSEGCYKEMFSDCTSLKSAPDLPATILAKECYSGMFANCTSLETAPELPATELAESCYGVTESYLNEEWPYGEWGMFYNCKSLKVAPRLPATRLTKACYAYMFDGCTSLISPPSLLATELAESCYFGMFHKCSSLVNPPELPATKMEANAYTAMFSECTALETAPDLPATTLAKSCYGADIVITKAHSMKIHTENGMFYKCESLKEPPELTATALDDKCYAYMFYGCTSLTETPKLPATTLADSCYEGMFYDCKSIKEPSTLPSRVLKKSAYESMYSGCISLEFAPDLPATSLANACYSYMFYDCQKITDSPALPATTLAKSCYSGMFCGCDNITTAPELPATILTTNCYRYMFCGCDALKEAPILSSTTLADNCYESMFSGCDSLQSAPELPATKLAYGCYAYMISGCSLIKTAPKLNAVELETYCYTGMFYGCDSLAVPPELPATKLAPSCYGSMFSKCTSLKEAPRLPAMTLELRCYSRMFSDCIALENPPELPATILTDSCYAGMFEGCRNLKRPPELPATTLASQCYTFMFENCSGLRIYDSPYTEDGAYQVEWKIPVSNEVLTASCHDIFNGCKIPVDIKGDATYYIRNKDITLNAKSADVIYDGEEHFGEIEVENPLNNYTISYSDSKDGVYTTDNIGFTNPGEHKVYYKVESENYNTKAGYFYVVIRKGDGDEKTIIANTKDRAYVYDKGYYFANIEVSVPNDGYTVLYSKNENGNFSPSTPSYYNCGTYTVYYKIIAEGYEKKEGSYKLTIADKVESCVIYRVYNRNTGEHLFTANYKEAEKLTQKSWVYEGGAFCGFKQEVKGSYPVYRVYNPNAKGGDHHYTKSIGEVNKLVKLGWKKDNKGKPLFYTKGDVKVYKLYNKKTGRHHYTKNSGEYKKLCKNSWIGEGTAWQAASANDKEYPAAVEEY